MSSCSVVIVSYQTGPIIFATIKAVLQQKELAQLILVNNGNRPDIVARLQQMALMEPKLKIISGEEYMGFAKAANFGAKDVTSDYVCFLRPDCLMQPETLSRMMAGFSKIPGTMITGCAIVGADGKPQNNPQQAYVAHLLRLIGKEEKPAVNINEIHEAEKISSALICMRTEKFRRLDGFDEGYFLHGANRDLFMRAREIGGKLVEIPDVILTNIEDFDNTLVPENTQWHRAKGTIRYYKKHFKDRWYPGAMLFISAGALFRYITEVAFEDIERWRLKGRNKQRTLASKRLLIIASGQTELSQSREFSGKTVFVTGATSEIGLCVIRRLIACGASVLALSRNNAIPFEHNQLRWIKDDLDNKKCSLHGYYADIAVHCAPLWYLPPAITMLKEAGVKRIVAFSTTAIFNKPITNNWFEKQMVEALSRAEINFEDAIRDSGINWTILRTTMLYGVGLDKYITRLYKLIHTLGVIAIYPPASGRCHPVHTDDLAIAVTQAINAPATYGKSYNLSGGEVLTYHELLERLFNLCNKKVRILQWRLLPYVLDIAGVLLRKEHINGEDAYRMNEDLLFFHEAAKKDFGYSPRTFLSGGIRDIEGI